ncbi:RxLR effector protein Htp1 [Frankliniella fusca]|uniref:RxLR effector protein Htp1 n=1 Tax=Frankliniella fusca TaxID=407009 RepID=A0AAE1HF86_9NEOP|nr:RxLR effector protein Htp1 [Frankliniella fusca]
MSAPSCTPVIDPLSVPPSPAPAAMARNTIALLLCALAAASAARLHPASQQLQITKEHAIAHHEALIREADLLIADLEAQVDSLLREALENHRMVVLSGVHDKNCIAVAFNGAVASVARLLKVVDEVRGIVQAVSVDATKCGWNPFCYVNVVKKAVGLLGDIKKDAQALVDEVKETVSSIKNCVHPPKPTSEAPTDAPTEAPTAAPSDVPTDAPSPAPGTEVPADQVRIINFNFN